MNRLNKLMAGMFSVLILSGLFTSCNDDDVKLASLNVNVLVSDDITGVSSEGLYVFAINTIDNSNDSAMVDAAGIAAFTKMAPGTYNISCTKNLTAEEASVAAGYFEELTLNGTETAELMADVLTEKEITLAGSPSNPLIIKEVYTAGVAYPTMYKDQYIEIYNNSSEVVYADGLYLASIVPQRAGANDNDVVSTLSFDEYIYANKISRIPGAGTENPIQPGESMVIALNGYDWTEGGTIDGTVNLNNADFELYAIDWLEANNRQGSAFFDIDNADVPNMEMVYLNIENYGWMGFDAGYSSVAILRCNEVPSETILDTDVSTASNQIYYTKLKVDDVIDAVDILANADAKDFKRLPSTIDAGFAICEEGAFSGLKHRRKEAKTVGGNRVIYKDTNNSSEDFEKVLVTE